MKRKEPTITWDDVIATDKLVDMLHGKEIYLMDVSNVQDKKKPLTKIQFGMVLGDKVVFTNFQEPT
jgi:hypothetical protein